MWHLLANTFQISQGQHKNVIKFLIATTMHDGVLAMGMPLSPLVKFSETTNHLPRHRYVPSCKKDRTAMKTIVDVKWVKTEKEWKCL